MKYLPTRIVGNNSLDNEAGQHSTKLQERSFRIQVHFTRVTQGNEWFTTRNTEMDAKLGPFSPG